MPSPPAEWAAVLVRALHYLGAAFYLGSLVFLLVIFQRVYGKYRSYKFVDNFRAELIQMYWKFLHGGFLLIVFSGAVLAGMKGKSVMQGNYGLLFSTKMALWLVQIYFTYETLKPFTWQVEQADANRRDAPPQGTAIRVYWIVILLLLISFAGFGLKLL